MLFERDAMKKYRKKPIVIDAIKYDGDNFNEIVYNFPEITCGLWKGKALDIKTLEGIMKAQPGDYIIKGVKGEFYPCKPDIFEMTYEEVKE